MTNSIAERPRISELVWSSINLLHRYRALSLDLFQTFIPNQRRDTLRVALDRQCPAWLCRTTLEDRQPCYALGRRGQHWFGMRPKKGFPFGKDGLLEHIAIATFCALAGYRRLLPEEFKSQFEDCHRKGLSAQGNCIDEANPGRIAWVIVDHASSANRFGAKLANVLANRLPLKGFQQLLYEERFQLVVLTAEEDKAKQIRSHLEERAPLSAPVSVIAIPGLLQFLL